MSTPYFLLDGISGGGFINDLLKHTRSLVSFTALRRGTINEFSLLQNSNSRILWYTGDQLLSNCLE